MVGTGAWASACPRQAYPEAPTRPTSQQLKTVTGQPLDIDGEKCVSLELDSGRKCQARFCVAD
eukprot:6231982-Alexandrium_andersonii.AAC.1